MKKGIIVGVLLAIIAICVVIISSTFSSTPLETRVNSELKQKIEATHTTPQYYVSEIEDDGSIVRVTLILRFTPKQEIQLKNIALPTCMEIVNFLKEHSLKRNVSVWLQKPAQTKGFTVLYGRAFYSISTGTVEWELKK